MSNDRERQWIKSLMNTLQDISVDDPGSLKMLYDIQREEIIKNVAEAKSDFKNGVTDPIR